MASEHNHDHFQHDLSFSGSGGVETARPDMTSPTSRDANQQAAEVLRNGDNERAFPVAGSGGSINERSANHEYGW